MIYAEFFNYNNSAHCYLNILQFVKIFAMVEQQFEQYLGVTFVFRFTGET